MNFDLSTASLAGVVVEVDGGPTGTRGAPHASGMKNPVNTAFAALLAGDYAPAMPGVESLAEAFGVLDTPTPAVAWGELVQELSTGEDGNLLPPDGMPLPLPGRPELPAGFGSGADGARRSGAPGDPLARMLSIVQLLQVPATDTPPGAAGSGSFAQAGMELTRVEVVETPRQSLPLVALPATANPGAAAPPAGEQAQPLAFPLPAQPGRPQWGNALGERVLWMAANRVQVAQLRLNPPELGPVEVRVRLDDDSLRLAFTATTSGAREALEAAAPRLREIFVAEGLALCSLDIGQRDRGERQESDSEASTGRSDSEDAEPARETGAEQRLAARRAGLVDVFV